MHASETKKPQTDAFARVCGLTCFTLDIHDSSWRWIRADVFQFPITLNANFAKQTCRLAHLADFLSWSEQHQTGCRSDASTLKDRLNSIANSEEI